MPLYDNKSLYNSISELDIIDKRNLDTAAEEAEKKKLALGDVILKKELIPDEVLGHIIADLNNIPYIQLRDEVIADAVLQTIPQVVAEKQKIIAFKKDEHGLHVAFSDPRNVQMRDFLKRKLGLPIIVYYASERDIFDALRFYSKNLTETFNEIISSNLQKLKKVRGLEVEPPIIKIVDSILTHAYQNKASDIHIEPEPDSTLVRFRIDGVLHDIVDLPINLHKSIVTRIKVMANLRTDEHLAAQDGKLQFKIDFASDLLDVRVSVVPITRGEKIVMRLLSEHSRQLSLTELGFSRSDDQKVKKAYEKPFGLILATGPTGSGKTTTMYAILKLLNRREVNIATIEDPVEYDIEGINQIQVNPKTNLTFVSGLRSILRQDPNIILVGEIRDEETAAIAVNAAMTGHLVLSTLHTNDAATTIPRLLEMKIEPYLIASTVNLVIAERLVRKIHLACRVSKEVEVSLLEKQFGKEVVNKVFPRGQTRARIYFGKSCTGCGQTRYEGRVGIFEVMEVNDEIRQAITAQKDAQTIKKIAIKVGMKTMVEDGLAKVKDGVTTIEEVIRATKE